MMRVKHGELAKQERLTQQNESDGTCESEFKKASVQIGQSRIMMTAMQCNRYTIKTTKCSIEVQIKAVASDLGVLADATAIDVDWFMFVLGDIKKQLHLAVHI